MSRYLCKTFRIFTLLFHFMCIYWKLNVKLLDLCRISTKFYSCSSLGNFVFSGRICTDFTTPFIFSQISPIIYCMFCSDFQMSRNEQNVINPCEKPDLGNLVGLQLNTLEAHILPNRKRSWQLKWTELVFLIAGKSFYIIYSYGAWSAIMYCLAKISV